jgi:predicted DNA-binding ribbon-helix-helix protein
MKYLPIYLNDHYAGSTLGVELAKRAAKNNDGNAEFGPPLATLASEIDEDRDALKRIMAALDVSEDRIKASIFWLGEKVGRLKPNGDLLQFSPLSRVVELEGLITGVSGKLSLWRTLLELAEREDRLEEGELEVLAGRAEDQLLRLHALRGAAGLIAFLHDIS